MRLDGVYIMTSKSFHHYKKSALPFGTTQMNLENIILSELNQSQKDHYCVIPLHEAPKIVKLIKEGVEGSLPGTWGWGGERNRNVFNWYEVSVTQDE